MVFTWAQINVKLIFAIHYLQQCKFKFKLIFFMTRLIFRHREREEKQKQVDFETKMQNFKSIDMQASCVFFFWNKKWFFFRWNISYWKHYQAELAKARAEAKRKAKEMKDTKKKKKVKGKKKCEWYRELVGNRLWVAKIFKMNIPGKCLRLIF